MQLSAVANVTICHHIVTFKVTDQSHAVVFAGKLSFQKLTVMVSIV